MNRRRGDAAKAVDRGGKKGAKGKKGIRFLTGIYIQTINRSDLAVRSAWRCQRRSKRKPLPWRSR
jgi:hypothetical protein